MEQFKKIMMIISLVIVILCLALCLYMGQATGDGTFYMMAAVFAAATVWFGFNVINLLKNK